MGDETKMRERVLMEVGKDRRIENQDQELRLMRWIISIGVLCIGGIATGAVALYQLDEVKAEVNAMPSPVEHQGVHALQDVDRLHIKEAVDAIHAQQTIDAVKIDNTEKNIWKIAQKLGVATE